MKRQLIVRLESEKGIEEHTITLDYYMFCKCIGFLLKEKYFDSECRACKHFTENEQMEMLENSCDEALLRIILAYTKMNLTNDKLEKLFNRIKCIKHNGSLTNSFYDYCKKNNKKIPDSTKKST